MKEKLLNLLSYFIVVFADFYLLPFAMRDTGSAILILVVIMPMVVFICGLVYGIKHGMSYILPLAVAILFVPAMFIFLNASAWMYGLTNTFICLLGIFIGKLIKSFYNGSNSYGFKNKK